MRIRLTVFSIFILAIGLPALAAPSTTDALCQILERQSRFAEKFRILEDRIESLEFELRSLKSWREQKVKEELDDLLRKTKSDR